MGFIRNKNSLRETFQNAARAVAEWNDTLLYSGLSIAATGNLALGSHLSSTWFLGLAAGREVIRMVSWHPFWQKLKDEKLILVGQKSSDQQNKRYAHAATFGSVVTINVAASFFLSDMYNISLPQAAITFSPFLGASWVIGFQQYRWAGGLRNIIQAYTEMWDWPRDKGGPPLTQKVKNAGKALLQRLKPPLPAAALVSYGGMARARPQPA